MAAIVLGPFGFTRLPGHAKFAMLAQQSDAGGCNEFGQENDWFHISWKPGRGPFGSIHVSNSVDLQKRSFAAKRSGREARAGRRIRREVFLVGLVHGVVVMLHVGKTDGDLKTLSNDEPAASSFSFMRSRTLRICTFASPGSFRRLGYQPPVPERNNKFPERTVPESRAPRPNLGRFESDDLFLRCPSFFGMGLSNPRRRGGAHPETQQAAPGLSIRRGFHEISS